MSAPASSSLLHLKSNERNGGIDLLRGVSILLVICHHIGLRLPLAKGMLVGLSPRWLLLLLNWRGYQAVFIFFVLSGFLIAHNSIARWGGLGLLQAGDFYRRRAARILPPLLILLVILSGLHLLHVPGYVIKPPAQSLTGALGSALGLYLNWYEGLTGYLPANWDVLWSLSVEELFYLGFPVVCLLLRRDWLLAPALAGFGLAMPYWLATMGGSEVWQEKAYLPGMAAIALGVFGALLTRWAPRVPAWVTVVLCATGAAGVALSLGATRLLWSWFGDGYLLILALATLALLLGFHWQAQTGRAWQLPGTRWLQVGGRCSYEIYLTHMFVVLPAVGLYQKATQSLWWAWILYPPMVALCWGLGGAAMRWVSAPSARRTQAWMELAQRQPRR